MMIFHYFMTLDLVYGIVGLLIFLKAVFISFLYMQYHNHEIYQLHDFDI